MTVLFHLFLFLFLLSFECEDLSRCIQLFNVGDLGVGLPTYLSRPYYRLYVVTYMLFDIRLALRYMDNVVFCYCCCFQNGNHYLYFTFLM